MNSLAGRKPEDKGRPAHDHAPGRDRTVAPLGGGDRDASAGRGGLQALADASERVGQLSARRTAINSSPRVAQLQSLWGAAQTGATGVKAPERAAPGPTPVTPSGPVVQRYPVFLREQQDGSELYTDSKHAWMRMIHRPRLSNDTFELTGNNGAPAASYMIFEKEYDQYRFSPDGREIEESVRPHFMEEITGHAEIEDEVDDRPTYSYAGEYGVGYRPSEGKYAEIEMSGMIRCVGFVLESEGAAFACHMLVSNQAPQHEATLKDQVNALATKYQQQAGHRASNCRLLYDAATYTDGPPAWLDWMAPTGIHTIKEVAHDLLLSIVGQNPRPTAMWRGDRIRY